MGRISLVLFWLSLIGLLFCIGFAGCDGGDDDDDDDDESDDDDDDDDDDDNDDDDDDDSVLSIGDAVPDFALPGHDGSTFQLSEYAGRKVLLSSAPFDHTPV